MKTILRKTTALFMAFLICLTGMPFTALADVTDSSNSFSLANVSALTALELAPRSAVIPVGASQTFVASLVTGGSAQVIDGGECKWSSNNDRVATVKNGVVTGLSAGTAQITCTYSSGSDTFTTLGMVTVTNASYRLIYESNYPDDAQKYTYQNGNTASVGDAVDTTVNYTYQPGATATVLDDVFTTINYDLTHYEDADGKEYKVGETIEMTGNLTLIAQWEKNGNTQDRESIRVRYYEPNGRDYVERTLTATLVNNGYNSATVTFITGNNQDTINLSSEDFYGWTINGENYEFNEQVTTTAEWVRTGWGGGYWLVKAYPLIADPVSDRARAQFFVRKIQTSGDFTQTSNYYSVGSGVISTQPGWSSTTGIVAGADNVNADVTEYIVEAPSIAQIANLMNIELDEATSIRWYVIKWQTDGYHVDGVMYLKDKYWNVEFIDPDDNQVVNTLLVEDASSVTDINGNELLDTDLRKFLYWSLEPDGEAFNFDEYQVTGDLKLYAVFERYAGYTVKYLEEGTNRQLAEPTTHTATVGETVAADKLNAPKITGYSVFNRDPESIKIESQQGIYTFTIYYKRNSYPVTYEYTGDVPLRASRLPEEKEYNYGAEVKVEQNAVAPGYTFSGWKTDDAQVNDSSFTMPAQTVKFTGYFTENEEVTIQYEVSDEAAGSVSLESESVAPATGEAQGSKATANTGYRFTGWTLEEDDSYSNTNASLTPGMEDDNDSVIWTERTYVANFERDFKDFSVTPYKGVYDAQAHGVTVTGTVTGDIIEYATSNGEDAKWSQKLPTYTDVCRDGDNNVITYPVYVRVTNNGKEDIKESYVKITPAEVTVTTPSASKTYDGTALTAKGSISGFVNNETATFQTTGTQTDVGSSSNTYTLTWEGTAKESNYTVIENLGALTITPRSVTLTSATDEKEYDGEPLTNDEVTVSGDGFVEGEGATYTVTGSQTLVGESENTFEYTLNEGTKAGNYNITQVEGKLTVTDREEAYEITVVAKSGTEKYDGEEKSISGFVTTAFEVEGNTYTVEGLTAGASGTDAGGYPAVVTGTAVVKDADGNDVTEQFSVTTQDGALTITKRNVTLTSATDEKEYDGTALTNDEVTVSGDGFVEGEGATYTVTGSQTLVGESENTFEYTLNEGTKAGNYEITTEFGTLKVTNRTVQYVIEVVAKSATVKYDGKGKSISGFETLEFVVNGQTYTVEGLSAVANGTEAGEYTAQVTGTAIVKDVDGNDVTEQFAVTTKDGTLTITPRSVTLTSATAQKEYDGTALTNDEVTVSGDGFVEGEGAAYEVTGSQLIAGNSDNVFTYELNEGTKAENYKIDVVYGKLTVTDREAKYEITVVANSATEKYDGTVKSVSGFETLEFVVNGQTYTVEGLSAEAKGTDAGDYTAAVTGTAVVKDVDGNDVTKQFTVNTQAGKLTVQPREITLTSASDEKEYDGTALTNDEVTVSGDGFADGEGFAYDVTGSQTLVGSSENIFTYAALEGTKLANYMIATVFGTLTVVDESVDPNNVVTKTHEDKEYDLNEIVTFTIRVTNIYDEVKTITLREIEGVTLAQSVFEDVQPGDTIVATATYQITESDILNGSFVNTVTATFSDGGTFENTDEVTPEEPNGHLTINKVTTSTPENGTGYALGETITYKITVVNDGNLTLTGITVTDDLTGDEWTIPSLKPGAEETFTAEYVVTEADILAGSVKNVATATGTSPDPDDPDPGVDPGEEEDETEDKNGHLTINKVTTSTPENGTGYALGETITYEITVVNDGNLTITDITVTDDLTGDEWTIPSLEPGAEQTFTAEYVVTEADILAGSVKNVATATGTSPDPDDPDPGVDPGEEEDETEDKNGHLTINKVTTSTPENGTGYALGETITYEITVVNDGNLTITDITVTDDLTGDEWTIPSLEPGAEQTFTAEYVVTEADILAGSVKNVATATGTSPDPDDPDPGVDPGEEEDETEDKNGHLTINKVTTSTPENGTGYALGETITYEITVVNDGNLTITDITVTDDLTGDEWTIPSLEPGAEQTFTAEYVVTEADILAGSVKNVATATGTSPDDPDDPDDPDEPEVDPGEEDTPTEDKNGHLTIEKETTGADANNDGVYEEGETIRYLIRVINDGNLTITDITVTDELTGDTWTIESLEPGAEQTFTTSHVVSSADGAAGVVVNVATATGTSPDPEQPDVPVTPGTEEVPTEEEAIRTDLSARINYVYIGNSALNRTERLYDLTQGEVITDIGSRVLRNTIDGYTVSRVEGLPMTVRVTESRNVITVYYEPQILTEILDLEVPTGASLGGLNVGDCCE